MGTPDMQLTPAAALSSPQKRKETCGKKTLTNPTNEPMCVLPPRPPPSSEIGPDFRKCDSPMSEGREKEGQKGSIGKLLLFSLFHRRTGGTKSGGRQMENPKSSSSSSSLPPGSVVTNEASKINARKSKPLSLSLPPPADRLRAVRKNLKRPFFLPSPLHRFLSIRTKMVIRAEGEKEERERRRA